MEKFLYERTLSSLDARSIILLGSIPTEKGILWIGIVLNLLVDGEEVEIPAIAKLQKKEFEIEELIDSETNKLKIEKADEFFRYPHI